jgi:pyruvate dehydrogenase kinase 2/3/4
MHEGPVGLPAPAPMTPNVAANSALASASRMRIPLERRYFSPPPASTLYPPEVHDYNDRFTRVLETIKKRHDPTVTTVAQGVLEWKKQKGGGELGQGVQQFLDRFYMSRIGIRFLIGQREFEARPC